MRRVLIVAFAIVASLAVMTAPVEAATAVKTVSINETDTDFNNAATLSNVIVNGTGDAAYVEPTSVNQTYTAAGNHQFEVPTGISSLTIEVWGGDAASANGGHAKATFPVTPGETLDVNVASGGTGTSGGEASDVRQGGTALADRIIVGGGAGGDAVGSGDLGGGGVGGGGSGGANTGASGGGASGGGGMQANGGGGGDKSSGGSGGSASGADTNKNGNAGSLGTGGASVSVNNGAGDSATSGEGGDGYYGGGSGGAAADSPGGDIVAGGGGGGSNFIDSSATSTAVNERGVSANNGGDGTVTLTNNTNSLGTYISQTHVAEDAQQGFTNLTLTNGEAIVTWLADTDDDGTFETEANSSTFSTTGNHTLDLSGTVATKWRVNVTFRQTSQNPTLRLHDEGVRATTHVPTVDAASADPSGGEQVNQRNIELSIDINDTDFAKAHGDSLTAEFFVNGSSVGTDTLNANGTGTLSYNPSVAGTRQWHVDVDDQYGNSVSSSNFLFNTPGVINIRNETHPKYLLIQNKGQAEVLVYPDPEASDPEIFNRSTADGTISLGGVDISEDFIVTVEVDGYLQRSIYVQDVFAQSSIFLINDTLDANGQVATVVWQVEDETGEFTGQNTKVVIEKSINTSEYPTGRNDSWRWIAISGDRVGSSSSFNSQLVINDRYRAKVINDDGDVRILGTYTPLGDDTVTLRPVPVGINVTDVETFVWNASQTNTSSGGRIDFEYHDPEDNTTDLTVSICEQGNVSNCFADQTVAGPIGTVTITQALTASEQDKNWNVTWSATREGETIGGKRIVGQHVEEQIPELPDWVQNALAIVFTVMFGAAFSVVNHETGAVATSFVGGGFWMAGWLPTEAGGAILVALFISVIWKAGVPQLR